MVGFNRRFAKILIALREAWGGCGGPQVVHYTVNAGALEPGSWYRQSDAHGTRFVGEGGHFIDTVSWWLGADPVSVQAVATPGDPDNLIALLNYPDGSVAKIAYLTAGDPKYPKEVLEAFGDGKVARMDNFRRTEVWRCGKCRKTRATLDKGQKQELEAFIAAVKNGASMPVAFDSLVATTACTLAVGRSIARGQRELVAGWECLPEQRTAEEESPFALRAAQ
jgi:predicted dehydrogenase